MVLLLTGLLSLAQADVISMGEDACGPLKAGDCCEIHEGAVRAVGECIKQTCSRLDYSTNPPGSKEYDCLICEQSDSCSGDKEKSGCSSTSMRPLGALSVLLGVGMLLGLRRR